MTAHLNEYVPCKKKKIIKFTYFSILFTACPLTCWWSTWEHSCVYLILLNFTWWKIAKLDHGLKSWLCWSRWQKYHSFWLIYSRSQPIYFTSPNPLPKCFKKDCIMTYPECNINIWNLLFFFLLLSFEFLHVFILYTRSMKHISKPASCDLVGYILR